MSLCETCRAPGSCCSGFVLSLRFPIERWKQAARREMKKRGLPFFPVRKMEKTDPFPQEGMVAVQFECRWLGANGRCTNYIRRPITCHHYEPGIDYLCAEHIPMFKGIPVRYEGGVVELIEV